MNLLIAGIVPIFIPTGHGHVSSHSLISAFILLNIIWIIALLVEVFIYIKYKYIDKDKYTRFELTTVFSNAITPCMIVIWAIVIFCVIVAYISSLW